MEFCRKIQKDWFRHQKRSGASWMNACVLLDRLCQDATQTFQVEVEGWSSTNDEDGGNTPAPWRLHVLYPLASMSWISKNTPASLRYARKHLSSPIFQVLWFFEGKALKIRNCRDWIVLLGPLPLLPLSFVSPHETSWHWAAVLRLIWKRTEAHFEIENALNETRLTPADELIMQYACVFESFSLFFWSKLVKIIVFELSWLWSSKQIPSRWGPKMPRFHKAESW